MKKILIAIGLTLASAGAMAHHTEGLKNFQDQQVNNVYGTSVEVTGSSRVPNFQIINHRPYTGSPVVRDPTSCAERWGAHCVAAPVHKTEPLSLSDSDSQEFLDPRGTSVNGKKWGYPPKPEAEVPAE